MRTNTELDHAPHETVGRILNLLLADEYMLYKATRDYHWNVTGPDFCSLRLLFQMQHEVSTGWVDEVAERIRQMQLNERISWSDLKESARCSAAAGSGLSPEFMLAELLHSHDEIIARLHSDIDVCRFSLGDAATADFLTRLTEQHENAAWMLRAQLENANAMPSRRMAS